MTNGALQAARHWHYHDLTIPCGDTVRHVVRVSWCRGAGTYPLTQRFMDTANDTYYPINSACADVIRQV